MLFEQYYTERPPLIIAQQFTGGQENYQELRKWLDSYGADLAWFPELVRDAPNKTIDEFATLNYLSRNYRLMIGDWIVIKLGGRGFDLLVYADEKFDETFQAYHNAQIRKDPRIRNDILEDNRG